MDRNHPFPKRCLLTLLLILVALSPQVRGQESQKQKEPQGEDVIRVYTDLVQTDVMVFDKQGHFVNGLKREDFALSVDGKPQPIEFFDRVTAGSTTEEAQLAALRGKTANNTSAPTADRGRTILFYVDDFHLSPGNLVFLRKALLKFIDNDLGQNDEAVITSASGQIGFLQQLTDNKTVLREAVARIKARPNPVQDRERPIITEYQALLIDRNPAAISRITGGIPDLLTYFVQKTVEETGETREAAEIHVRGRARTILQQGALITTNVLSAFDSLVKTTSELPGRKLAFFVSDGFFLDTRNSDAPQRLEQITRTAARNGVVVYSLDARALTTGLPSAGDEVEIDPSGTLARETVGELSASRDAMATLAVDTGGRTIFNTNDFEAGLVRAVKETSDYYLLAWRANHEMQTARKLPRIQVSVLNRPEYTVRLHHGFREATPTKKPEMTAAKEKSGTEKPAEGKLRESLLGIYPNKDLPVALDLQYQNTPDKGMVLTTTMQVPADSLSLTSGNEKQSALVDIAGLVYDNQGKVKANFVQRGTLTSRSSGQDYDALTFSYSSPLPPGLYQVRIGARDISSGRTGSVFQWIEIPDLSSHKLTLSSVLAGERLLAPAGGNSQAPRTVMRADHRFHRDAALRFQLYVYEAKASSPEAKPDLVIQVQVIRDRLPVISMPSRQIAILAGRNPNEIRTGGEFALKDLAPGRYLLLVTVIDLAAKSSASQEMRFEVD